MAESSKAGQGQAEVREIAGKKRQLLVLKMTSKELTVTMSSVKEEDIDALVNRTVEVQITSINMSMFSIFEFQGFDPNAIIRKLVALQQHYKLSDDELKEDIMYMCAANIYMGNLSGKALGRRSQDGRDMIDDLATRYQVKVGSTGTGLASDIITFPRVAGSFPVLSCRMADVLPSKTIVGKPFNSVLVPRFMRMNAFASFCPMQLEDRSRMFLLKCVAAYSCDLSITFEEGKKKKMGLKADAIKVDHVEIASNQWDFIVVSSDSPIPQMSIKKKLLLEFNVLSYYDVLLPIVTNYNDIMKLSDPVPTRIEFEKDITAFCTSPASTT
jgi:hypothetical protein